MESGFSRLAGYKIQCSFVLMAGLHNSLFICFNKLQTVRYLFAYRSHIIRGPRTRSTNLSSPYQLIFPRHIYFICTKIKVSYIISSMGYSIIKANTRWCKLQRLHSDSYNNTPIQKWENVHEQQHNPPLHNKKNRMYVLPGIHPSRILILHGQDLIVSYLQMEPPTSKGKLLNKKWSVYFNLYNSRYK